ncbi:MAG: hypothetical protein K8F32_01925 [Rhodocyclaceae bacterium]|nr:hypothetical protein [Rhodocyclaceae bacterium]
MCKPSFIGTKAIFSLRPKSEIRFSNKPARVWVGQVVGAGVDEIAPAAVGEALSDFIFRDGRDLGRQLGPHAGGK